MSKRPGILNIGDFLRLDGADVSRSDAWNVQRQGQGFSSFTRVHIFHTFSEKCLELRFQVHIDQIPCILVITADSSLRQTTWCQIKTGLICQLFIFPSLYFRGEGVLEAIQV